MKPFIPNTPHVNEDRKYFVDGFAFIKEDSNLKRGLQEARNLIHFRGAWFAPEFRKSEEIEGRHRLHMSNVPGETLENCRDALTEGERATVAFQLLKIVAWMMDHGLRHGDLNESNVVVDRLRGQVFLVDFEMVKKESNMDVSDIYGPDSWGLIHLFNYLKAPKA